MTGRQEETNILNACMLRLSTLRCRVFRNATAQGWVGRSERVAAKKQVWLYPGDVVVRGAHPLHAGLCIGSADIIGWTSIEITEAMVGKRVAVFTAAETKTKDGRPSDDQERFIEAVRQGGGIAGIVRSPDDAEALVLGRSLDRPLRA